MTIRRAIRVSGNLCLAAFATFGLLGGCSEDEHAPILNSPPATGGKKATGGSSSKSGGADAGGMGGTGAETASGGMGGELGTPVNCGDLVCEGEGAQCTASGSGVECTCKAGYLIQPKGEGFECVVDTSCVKVRPLEGGCRVELQGAPTVALFFAVDYCAGTAVLPAALGDIDTAFVISEDGQPLQIESKTKVIPRDVESFVTIALDVSSSVTIENPSTLAQLTDGLKKFLTEIERPVGKPPVTVSLLVFARDVGLMVPFTGNTEAIASALDAIKADPNAALAPYLSGSGGVPNLSGTTLMGAVKQGIDETERMQSFRRVVTNNGVLTTGTLLVVTDGEDSNKAPLPANVSTTLVNIISLGVSNDIKGTTLASVGRDGAFLAPTQASLSEAFTRIAKRVNEHPDRAYLLGYCSATTTGNHDVRITVDGKTNESAAGCTFNANVFGNDICDVNDFATKCDDAECGSMFACGACADDACCAGTSCAAPSGVTGDCRGIDELCEPGQYCVENLPTSNPKTYSCQAPVTVAAECSATAGKCETGAAYCDTSTNPPNCVAVTLNTGDVCQDATGAGFPGARCPEGNCARENSSQSFRCEEQARMFDECSGSNANALCERGTLCATTCRMRYPTGMFTCSTHEECASGYCDPAVKLCTNVDGQCHYSWDEKLR
jgi:hypothetical protein